MTNKPRPDLVAVARNADHYLLHCMICSMSYRIELPILDSELQRIYGEFAGAHRHAITERPGGLHCICPDCDNEDQSRFRHVCDEPSDYAAAVEITFECLECGTMISDWFEVEGGDDE